MFSGRYSGTSIARPGAIPRESAIVSKRSNFGMDCGRVLLVLIVSKSPRRYTERKNLYT